ncbi:hypothetical protein ACIRRA_41935 [Nocardia sp. NPDC101769]|uniref:hypothetical protein n=1 Tax=Nocardia sp. NPDC101769 TaxID=3364333 RepID=UPI0037F83EFD
MSEEPTYIVGFISEGKFHGPEWEPNSLADSRAEAHRELGMIREDDDVNPWAVYRLVKDEPAAGGIQQRD